MKDFIGDAFEWLIHTDTNRQVYLVGIGWHEEESIIRGKKSEQHHLCENLKQRRKENVFTFMLWVATDLNGMLNLGAHCTLHK